MRTLGILCLLVTSAVISHAQTAVSKIGDLKPMSGCWARRDDSKKLLITEQWMTPAGTSILGMGRTVTEGKTMDWEFMRIEVQADGLVFIAKPRGNQDETSFKMIRSTADDIVFENNEHDFPQRVIYKFSGAKLIGRIEGMNNGKFLGIDFPMDRVSCV